MFDPPEMDVIDATTPSTAASSLAGSAVVSSVLDGTLIVGVGWTARTVRELQVIAHGLVRVAVQRYGFRSVLLEGDVEASRHLDRFVITGHGDPRSIVSGATPYLASVELLDLIRWTRDHNERYPDRLVRFVHGGRDDTETTDAIEESLLDQVTGWHTTNGAGIIYVGGVAHVAVDERRVLAWDDGPAVASAGALLRRRFGDRFKTVALTFGRGNIPVPVPTPAGGSLEADLDSLGYATVAVRLPARVEAQRLRVVGPHYDETDDAMHSMVGDPTAWFDAYVHQRVGHTARPLDDGPTALDDPS